MSDNLPNVDEIFCAAIELSSPEERGEYVERACGGNAELRHRVDALLTAHFGAGDFLERSPATALLPDHENIQEGPGTLIGPYKLLEQIGEGGMGVVYMADQQAPVRRRVALKVIKTGMDTRQVVARFEAEREALALMDHSNIARVLDAGATDSGRPYFVMELVRGIPITEYCDQNNLPVHKRLELFVEVCHAVQHAHQKGIIHRDLKPSNVLVTLNDGRAVPKVIDFGVAKATGQQLTEKSLFTAFAQMVGTPLYMSPEQAEMTSVDIDTRSDIYSLGVLLYELLTGTTPFDQQRTALGSLRRNPPHHPRRGAAQTEHTDQHARRIAHGHGRPSPSRCRTAGSTCRRRPRLDRDEGPRKRPHAALRHGWQFRRRCAAPSQRRAGRGLPSFGRLPLSQVRAAEQGRARNCGACGRTPAFDRGDSDGKQCADTARIGDQGGGAQGEGRGAGDGPPGS